MPKPAIQNTTRLNQARHHRKTYGYTHDMKNSILLRDVSASDLPIFFEQQLDPEATAMAAFPSRSMDAFTAHWAKIMANESNILMSILFEGRVAGNMVSWEQDGEREVGYWLGREFWGNGIATQALAGFLGIVKSRPLYAHVAKHNIASRRVLEKCGFKIIRTEPVLDMPGENIEEYILELSATSD